MTTIPFAWLRALILCVKEIISKFWKCALDQSEANLKVNMRNSLRREVENRDSSSEFNQSGRENINHNCERWETFVSGLCSLKRA